MDSDRLAVFRAVAREGGFSRAAQRLFRTQPAVSQSIRALEEELGQRLFDRRGRRTTLTQAGRILLGHADVVFASLECARNEMAQLSTLQIGQLRVAASDTSTCHVLPPVLRAFRERHPGVELRISNRPSPAAAADVANREADLAVVTLPLKRAGLSTVPLVAQEDVAVFSPDHPLSRRKRIDLAQLARHPLLMLDRSSQTRLWLDAMLASQSLVPDVAMELGSVEVVKEMAALGFGVGVVPAFAVERESSTGQLETRRFLPRRHVRELGIVHAGRESLSAAAQVFIALSREILGGGRRP